MLVVVLSPKLLPDREPSTVSSIRSVTELKHHCTFATISFVMFSCYPKNDLSCTRHGNGVRTVRCGIFHRNVWLLGPITRCAGTYNKSSWALRVLQIGMEAYLCAAVCGKLAEVRAIHSPLIVAQELSLSFHRGWINSFSDGEKHSHINCMTIRRNMRTEAFFPSSQQMKWGGETFSWWFDLGSYSKISVMCEGSQLKFPILSIVWSSVCSSVLFHLLHNST